MSAIAAERAPRSTGRGLPRRVLVWLLALLVGVTAVFGAGAAFAQDDDDSAMKFSLYRMSSTMTSFFSSVQSPDSEDAINLEAWGNVVSQPANAGSLLGYLDPDFSLSTGWFSSQLSGSSDAIGYDTLAVKNADGEVVEEANGQEMEGLLDYAHFGAALNGLGLDGTSTGLSGNFFNQVSGGIVMLLYVLAGAVDFLFEIIIKGLAALNPFKLFFSGMQAISPTLANGMVGGDTSAWGPLSGLASWIGGWYVVLNDMAWAVMVPIFIAVLLAGLLMMNSTKRMSGIKKLLIRMFFIGLGLPLLGSMYTGALNSMAVAADSGNSGSTRVVLSTYVDFESWVMKNRLYVPENAEIGWSRTGDAPTSESVTQVRNTSLEINKAANANYYNINQVVSADSADSWTESAMTSNGDGDSSHAYANTMDILSRYMTGAQISSATFETAIKGELTDTDDGLGNDVIAGWFNDFSKSEEFNEKEAGPINSNPIISVAANSGLQRADDGSFYSADGTTSACYSRVVKNNSTDPAACNLSPLAMYNYLNTSFGPSSMTMYSSGNVASEATRSIHNSVNQVGTGAMSFLYWLNAVMILGSFVLIGFGYAVSMVIANIRRSVQLIAAVPFATLGAIAAIAKVIVYSFALILEVMLTIFVYKLVQELLLSLPQIAEIPFANAINEADTGVKFLAFLLGGIGLPMVLTVISILLTIAFTVMALRVRKTLVKGIEEVVTKLVEKFTETSIGTPRSGGGGLRPLAAGLGAGAGSALASRAMGGGGQGSNGRDGGSGRGSQGPSGVSLGGPQGPGGPGGSAGGVLGAGAGMLALGSDPKDPNAPGGAQGPGGPGAPGGDGGVFDDSQQADGALGAGRDRAAEDVELGKRVEAQGLSDGTGGYGERDRDAMDTFSDSVGDSMGKYAESDKKRMAAGKDAAVAAGYGALAAGRGMGGDVAGAVDSGSKALAAGSSAAGANKEAGELSKDAGRSSLDAPRGAEGANTGMGASAAAAAGSAANGLATERGQQASSGPLTQAGAEAAQGGSQQGLVNAANAASAAGTTSATGAQAGTSALAAAGGAAAGAGAAQTTGAARDGRDGLSPQSQREAQRQQSSAAAQRGLSTQQSAAASQARQQAAQTNGSSQQSGQRAQVQTGQPGQARTGAQAARQSPVTSFTGGSTRAVRSTDGAGAAAATGAKAASSAARTASGTSAAAAGAAGLGAGAAAGAAGARAAGTRRTAPTTASRQASARPAQRSTGGTRSSTGSASTAARPATKGPQRTGPVAATGVSRPPAARQAPAQRQAPAKAAPRTAQGSVNRPAPKAAPVSKAVPTRAAGTVGAAAAGRAPARKPAQAPKAAAPAARQAPVQRQAPKQAPAKAAPRTAQGSVNRPAPKAAPVRQAPVRQAPAPKPVQRQAPARPAPAPKAAPVRPAPKAAVARPAPKAAPAPRQAPVQKQAPAKPVRQRGPGQVPAQAPTKASGTASERQRIKRSLRKRAADAARRRGPGSDR